MLITDPRVQALMTGLNGSFRRAFDSTPEYTQEFTTTLPSSHKVETYHWMKDLAPMREWVGPRVVDNLENEAYTLVNKRFEKTIGFDVDDIEDDSVGAFDMRMTVLAKTARKWKDQQVKIALQNGKVAATFDGVPFFSTSHPLDPAGVQSNLYTSSALNATNFDTVRAAMSSLTGYDGEPLGVNPDLLVVAPQNEKNALEIVAGERNANGASNVLVGTARVLKVPELANEPTTWYLVDTTKGILPMLFQDRMAPQTVQKSNPDDDNVFYDNQIHVGVKARGAAGYTLWFLIARCEA